MEIQFAMQSPGWWPERTPRSGTRHQGVLAWFCSVAIHVIMLAGVIALFGRVHMHPPVESFRWEVALLESSVHEPTRPENQPSTQPTAPTQPQRPVRTDVQPVHPRTEPLTPIATQKPLEPIVQPVQHMIHQQPEPLVGKDSADHILFQTMPTQTAPHRSDATIVNRGDAIVHRATPSITPRESSLDRQIVRTTEGADGLEQAVQTSGQVLSHTVVSRTIVASLAPQPVRNEDYSWLATTLWKRVQAIKQYPGEAAANRLEGDVLLTAVVQADGTISGIRITQSSGHPLLDQAAVDALRKASPLTLFRPLGHAYVSVEIPIGYHSQS